MCYDSGCGVVADKHLAMRWFRAEIESLREVFEMDHDSIENGDVKKKGLGEEEEEEEEYDDNDNCDDDDDDEPDSDNLPSNVSDSQSPTSSYPPQPTFESDNHEYTDHFLGKCVCIEFKSCGHVEDALVLSEALTCLSLRRIDPVLGRSKPLHPGYYLSEYSYSCKYHTPKPQLPRPTFIYVEKTFSQPHRVRVLMGLTLVACHRLSAPPCGLYVYANTLKSWRKRITFRVLDVLESRAQVMQCLARFYASLVHSFAMPLNRVFCLCPKLAIHLHRRKPGTSIGCDLADFPPQ
jgi:hypothetical protein